jgi:hypothetical protein
VSQSSFSARSLRASDDGGTQRPAHDDGQLLPLGEVHRLPGSPALDELRGEVCHEVLEVQ